MTQQNNPVLPFVVTTGAAAPSEAVALATSFALAAAGNQAYPNGEPSSVRHPAFTGGELVYRNNGWPGNPALAAIAPSVGPLVVYRVASVDFPHEGSTLWLTFSGQAPGIKWGIQSAQLSTWIDPATVPPAPPSEYASSSSSSFGSGTLTPRRLRPRSVWPNAWYTEELKADAGPEWSAPEVVRADSGDPYLGPYTTESLRLTLADIPAHDYVSMGIEVFVVGGWNGNQGPSVFTISQLAGAVREPVFRATLATVTDVWAPSPDTQTYPAQYPGSAAYPGGNDAVELNTLSATAASAVYLIERSFSHLAAGVTLEFVATGLPPGAHWGISRVWLDPVRVYAVNEAFDASSTPQALVTREELPALCLSREYLGPGYRGSLLFVNEALPVSMEQDSFGYVTRIRFPVYGDPVDVELFWQRAESDRDTSPLVVLDRRARRVGDAGADAYPAVINPMAFVLGHVMAGNLIILKAATPTTELPLGALDAWRAFLPLSCGLLLHSEIRVGSTQAAIASAFVAAYDVVEYADNMHAFDDDKSTVVAPTLRVWAQADADEIRVVSGVTDIGSGDVFVSPSTGFAVDVSQLWRNGETDQLDTAVFPWWEQTAGAFVRISRYPSVGTVMVSLWPAGAPISVYVAGVNADILSVRNGIEGVSWRAGNGVWLSCVDPGALTVPLEFAITWKRRLLLISDSAVVTGNME